MSIIKNNKTYGVETKKMPANNQNKNITANGEYKADEGYDGLGTVTVNVSSVVWPEYLTGYYMVYETTNSLKILDSTSNISGYRVKGATTWETPVTTIAVNAYGIIEIEFNLTDNTTIQNNQFKGVNNLVKIDFPSTITRINNNAFFGSGLMEFPNFTNVTNIGNDCFYNCVFNYVDYTINDNVDRSGWTLKSMNFSSNSNFGEKMYVNGVVRRISKKYTQNGELDFTNGIGGLPIYKWYPYGDYFRWNLNTFKFPTTLTHITGRAFQRCTITNLYFYGTTPPVCETYDGEGIFYDSTITNIYVPAEALTAYQNSPDFADVVSKIQAMP